LLILSSPSKGTLIFSNKLEVFKMLALNLRSTVPTTVPKLILYFYIALSLSSCNLLYAAKSDLTYTHSFESKHRNYFIYFTPADTDFLPINRYFNLQVQVKGAMQQRLNFPLQLDFDAGMTAHNHGMNVKPKVENLGNGHYLIKGVLLHMSGQWVFEFTLRRGVLSEKAKIKVTL